MFNERDKKAPIDEIDDLNKSMNDGEDCLIWFFADWCGHCKNVMNDWEELYETHGKNYNLFKISDQRKDEVNNNIGREVNGFPQFLATSGNSVKSQHNGDRTFHGLEQFLKTNVKPIRSGSQQNMLRKPCPVDNVNKLNQVMNKGKDSLIWFFAPWCGHCKNMEKTWEDLYEQNKEKYNMFKISDSKKDSVNNNIGTQVQSFPQLIASRGNNVIAKHEGERTPPAIQDFINTKLKPNTKHKSNTNVNKSLKNILNTIVKIKKAKKAKTMHKLSIRRSPNTAARRSLSTARKTRVKQARRRRPSTVIKTHVKQARRRRQSTASRSSKGRNMVCNGDRCVYVSSRKRKGFKKK